MLDTYTDREPFPLLRCATMAYTSLRRVKDLHKSGSGWPPLLCSAPNGFITGASPSGSLKRRPGFGLIPAHSHLNQTCPWQVIAYKEIGNRKTLRISSSVFVLLVYGNLRRMRALVVKPGHKDTLGIIDIPKPVIDATQVLVKTQRVGIDGTDVEINQGAYGEAPESENLLVLGHEAVGRISEVGSDVRSLNIDDLVVPTVRRNCPDCPACHDDASDNCQSGDYQERGIKGAHGYLSEFFKEAPGNLVKLPRELEAVGSLIEPMSVAQKAVGQAFEIQRHQNWEPNIVLVLGAGALGLMLTLVSRSKGCDTFTYDLADSNSPKARIVEKAGGHYIDAKALNLEEFPKEHGWPDLIFEATGSSSVAFSAINILNQDGAVCLLSVSGRNHETKICLSCLNNHIVLGNRVIFGSVSSNRKHFQEAIQTAKYVDKQWPGVLNEIITDERTLDDYK